MKFTNAFLTASSCSPSRSSILTGRYPHNNGEAAELHRPISWHLPSIAGLLREAGYHTALAGKNHMSWKPAPEGETAPAEPWVKIYDAKVKGNSGGHGNWIAALEESPPDKPFFLWLAALDAHRAWDADRESDAAARRPMHDPARVVLPPALADTPETRQDFASYLNEVTRFDHFVGGTVDRLREAGRMGNTWLVVLTDNGRPFPRAKTRLIDDGMKTFLVVAGPGISCAGGVSNSLVSVVDLAPTFAELAGIPKSGTFQGRSLTPVFADPSAVIRPFAFSEHNWHDYEAHGRSVRDGRWPSSRNSGPPCRSRTGRFGEVALVPGPACRPRSSDPLPPIQADIFLAPRPETELYDTLADPHQVANLSGEEAAPRSRESCPKRWTVGWMSLATPCPARSAPTRRPETGDPPPGVKRDEAWKAPAGADRGADRIHAEGIDPGVSRHPQQGQVRDLTLFGSSFLTCPSAPAGRCVRRSTGLRG